MKERTLTHRRALELLLEIKAMEPDELPGYLADLREGRLDPDNTKVVMTMSDFFEIVEKMMGNKLLH